MLDDSYLHKGQRKRLIEELESKKIFDKKILEILLKIPRHQFIDSALSNYAYENKALPIECNQTLSHPFTVAFQTQLLDVRASDKILEIGTGSGYQTIILATLKAKVFSIERQKYLYDKFLMHPLRLQHKNIICFYGDGFLGLKNHAPFDKILITAAVPKIPRILLNQLKIGGHMVAPINVVGKEDEQEMKKIFKISDTEFKSETFHNFSFVPMLKGKK